MAHVDPLFNLLRMGVEMDAQHMPRRRLIIGIMGSGKASAHDQLAYTLGRLVAKSGYTLLTGGGAGVMEAASRGAAEAGGLVIGVLPHNRPTGAYPNPYVHI